MSLNTIIISRGPKGDDGVGAGSTAYGDLTDSSTVDLPSVNTPTGDAIAAAQAAAIAASASAAQGTLADSAVQPGDIDTLAELNAVITDATLIDTGDSRLSDARTPTAHAHTLSDISDAGTAAAAATGDFATAAQGATADSALQPGGALGTPSSGTLTNCTFPTLNQSTTGNAATATALETGREINGVSFDGSANITVTAAAGTLTGATLNATVTGSSLTSVGTIGTGVWQGTAIADAYISSSATWNAKGAAGQVETYLVDDGIHTITSASGVVTPDASNGVSQKFPLTENVTDFNTPTNLADGGSMLVQVLQDSTPRTLALDAAWKIMGGGVAADIGAIAAGEYVWLSISCYGTDYLISITTQV